MILSIYAFGSISEYIIGKMVMLYAPPDSDTSLDRRISLDNLDCMAWYVGCALYDPRYIKCITYGTVKWKNQLGWNEPRSSGSNGEYLTGRARRTVRL